jgi:formylglycine-generating enzyme required for sulfatase activity
MFKLLFTSLLFLTPVSLFAGLQTFCTGGKFTFKIFCIADMTINLWGWVYDYFGKGYYASGVKNNPKGTEKGKYRIFRGGSWNDLNVNYFSTSFRYLKKPGYKNSTVGFRLAIQI